MERLTRRNRDGEGEMPRVDLDTSYSSEVRLDYSEICALQEGINKLTDYEDAEENGTLVRLLCKVGDTVWWPASVGVKECIVNGFGFDGNIISVRVDGAWYSLDEFEDIFCITREEAEKAMKEREANG